MLSRRRFLTGLAANIAAPSVIRLAGVMPINAAQATPYATVEALGADGKTLIYKLWEPTSANQFAGMPEFKTISRIVKWDYGFPDKVTYGEIIPQTDSIRQVTQLTLEDQLASLRAARDRDYKEWKVDFVNSYFTPDFDSRFGVYTAEDLYIHSVGGVS